MTRLLAGFAMLAALLAIAGCGGDDEPEATAGTPSATTSQPTESATTPVPSDRAQTAQAIAGCVEHGAQSFKVSALDVLTGEEPTRDEEATSPANFNAGALARLASESGDGAMRVRFIHEHEPDNPHDNKDAAIEVFVLENPNVAVQQALDLARKNPGIEETDVVVVSQNALIFEADDERTSDQERDVVLGCVPARDPKTPAELADELPIDPESVGSCLSDRYGEDVLDWNDPSITPSTIAAALQPYLSNTVAEPDGAELNGVWTIHPEGLPFSADIYLYRDGDRAGSAFQDLEQRQEAAEADGQNLRDFLTNDSDDSFGDELRLEREGTAVVLFYGDGARNRSARRKVLGCLSG